MTGRVPDQLRTDWPPQAWHDLTVVLAVSGGADSMALLRAMCEVRTPGPGRLVVAHYNHGLRGADSDADEQFVADCCRQWELDCQVERAPRAAGHLAEEDSRNLRYEFLTRVASQAGARYVATAHTADDQAETILHHIIRGTGLSGLSGMPRVRRLNPAVVLIRPLLQQRRAELVAYLDAIGQSYRSDASNRNPAYTRNRIRHELLPLLREQYNPGVVDALLRLGQLADDAQRVTAALVEPLFARAVRVSSGDAATIDVAALAEVDRHLFRELLITLWRRQGWPQQGMGYAEWDELAARAQGEQAGTKTYAGAILAQWDGETLTLSRRQP